MISFILIKICARIYVKHSAFMNLREKILKLDFSFVKQYSAKILVIFQHAAKELFPRRLIVHYRIYIYIYIN